MSRNDRTDLLQGTLDLLVLKTLATLGERSGTSAMVISDALGAERLGWVFDPITPPVQAKK